MLLAFVSTNYIFAHTFEEGGIYYNINDGEASVTCKGNNVWALNYSYTGEVIIPDSVTYKGVIYAVTSIEYRAFAACTGLTTISIGNSVKTIGDEAFSSCDMSNVEFGNSISSIGNNSFSYCRNLTNINFPDSVKIIGSSSFIGCSGITSVSFPDSVKIIGSSSFSDCSALTSVEFGKSVTAIYSDAFKNCSALTRVNINDLSTWCNISFGNGKSNPLFYARRLFYNGTEVSNLIIPNNVTTISKLAFYCCESLISVNIPNSVTSIGTDAFCGCRNLTTANLPNSLSTIPNGLFVSCQSLTNVNIPNSVTTIGESAFAYCSELASIIIPSSVTSIKLQAFMNCTKLTEVYSYITDPSNVSLGSSSFSFNQGTLYVPFGTKTLYQNTYPWYSYFRTIIERDRVSVSTIELDKTTVEVTEGESFKLTATIYPDDATDKTITWTSSDENIAVVDATGLVTTLAHGSVNIFATSNDRNDLYAKCVVTVKEITYNNYFLIPDTTVRCNNVISIPVSLKNENDISAFQTDLYLPEGFELVKVDGDYLVELSDRKGRDHVIMSNDLDDGGIRIISYSATVKPYSGNEGELFYITVKTPDDGNGDYTIMLKNTLLTTTDHEELNAPDASCTVTVYPYIMGDANNSGTVTVTDIVVTARYILNYHPDPFVFGAADVNGDGNISVTDIVIIAQMIMDGEPVSNPRRAPARDGNLDRMSGQVINDDGIRRTVSINLDNAAEYTAFQLDLQLPVGMTANNFTLTDGSGFHILDANELDNGKTRLLCYTPTLKSLNGDEVTLLTFEVTSSVCGDIVVDGIEVVTADCQTATLNAFAITMDNLTSVDELDTGDTVAKIEYYNLTGQQIERPSNGATIVVTTFTNGTRSIRKVIR